MQFIENALRRLAVVQEKYPVLILLIVLVFTAVMAFGSLQMKLDPSFDGMMPDDLEVIRMQDVVSTEFGSTDTMLVLVGGGHGCACVEDFGSTDTMLVLVELDPSKQPSQP